MISVFLDPHPEEILYSAVARNTSSLNYLDLRSVGVTYFSDPHTIATVVLPCRLEYLVPHLPLNTGHTVDILIDEHALLPFFMPFLLQARVTQLRSNMRGAQGMGVHMRAGLMASTVLLPNSLRFCPTCAAEVSEHHGEWFWHRQHQAPGVHLCSKHHIWLEMSPVLLAHRQTRHVYIASENAISCLPPPRAVLHTPREAKLLAIAQSAEWLLVQKPLPLGLEHLRERHVRVPLYAYFLPFERALALRQGLKANGSTVFNINIAGARRSGIPHLQWLRYCPECINQDRITYGECYWHRLHQIPWVLVCPLHEVMLEDSSVNLIYGNKFAQFCSAERSVKNLSCRKASLHLRAALQQLARNTQWLLEQPILVEREYLDWQYMGLLVKQGFSTSTGQMRYGRLKEAMLDYYPAHLLEDLGCDISQRSCWLENWRKIQHPLHHLLLIQLLCETLQKFFTQPQQPPAPFGSGPWPCLNPLCSHYKVRIITSYTLREGHLNHPIGTFTCSCGFSYSRTGPDANDDAIFHAGRISQFGDLWDQHLTAYWLDQNISTTRIAQQMHSTFSTVCRQAARLGLPFAPDIPCRGKRPKIYQDFIQEQRSLYYTLLEEELRSHPDMKVRDIPSKIYHWFQQHDPGGSNSIFLMQVPSQSKNDCHGVELN